MRNGQEKDLGHGLNACPSTLKILKKTDGDATDQNGN
jgi:hypothetical protein